MLKSRITILLILLNLTGCVTFKEISDISKLKKFPGAAEGYAKVIRWSDFETASFYAKHMESKPDPEALKAYKVTAYEVKEIIHKKDELKVIQAVVLSYYKKANPTEKTIRYQEVWEFDHRDQAWYLSSGFPEFN